jgi:two-component system sensor histidine kinase KdpD
VIRFPVRAVLAWLIVLAGATAMMLMVRSDLEKVHIALLFLLIVLAGSAVSGRTAGITLASVSFLVFNWFFLPPYSTFYLANELDWLVLIAFLITGVVAAQLLYRAQEEARMARERAAEIDRLATLGAETLSVGSAAASLRAVTEVIRASTGASQCEIHLRDHDDGDALVDWVMESRNAAVEQRDGTLHLHSARPTQSELRALEAGSVLALLLPLEVRERVVGVLRVASADGLKLDPARWRFLDAISYYAALAVERGRLVAEAERTEALRETNRLKDALLASVSHDLRTPLTTIKALAHDLSALGDERSEIIEMEADRLNRTVADLLDLSSLNAGALPVTMELNAVDDLLGALSQRVESCVTSARLRFVLPSDQPLLVGNFDIVHSVRILSNLVENAAKYSPAEAPIDVVASRDGDRLLIRVEDRGPGIAENDVGGIFEPFYRSGSSSPDVGGAGLGLAIARRLAVAQGGSLDHAPRDGGGSIFTLQLPAVDIADIEGTR